MIKYANEEIPGSCYAVSMAFRYPYKSELIAQLTNMRDGQDYYLWHSGVPLQDRIAKLSEPIIEIGGPTEMGFFFLDGLKLNSKPVITNIDATPLRYSPKAAEFAKQVDEVMDATKMQYDDGSIGAFLMAAMSLSSDWWVNLDDDAKEEATTKFEAEFSIAKLEMGQAALSVLDPKKAIHAQRIKIYLEVHRTLGEGGLFFSEGGIEELSILKNIGFELVSFLEYQYPDAEGYQDMSYEFVVAK
jgi:hypothetical protein